jgi:hypothetical protein
MTQRSDTIELAYGLLWTLQIDTTTAEGAQISKARRNLLVLLDKQGQARGITAARQIHSGDRTALLAEAVDRMGWPEIHAFRDELRRGQDVFEDAGGFWMRAIRRLFGLPSPYSEVETYQQAARRMVAEASALVPQKLGEAP